MMRRDLQITSLKSSNVQSLGSLPAHKVFIMKLWWERERYTMENWARNREREREYRQRESTWKRENLEHKRNWWKAKESKQKKNCGEGN